MKSSYKKAVSALDIPVLLLTISMLVLGFGLVKVGAMYDEQVEKTIELEQVVSEKTEAIKKAEESYLALDTEAKKLSELNEKVIAEKQKLTAEKQALLDEKEALSQKKQRLESKVTDLKKQLQALN